VATEPWTNESTVGVCGHENQDGTRCQNPVSPGSFRCAARHPVSSSRWTTCAGMTASADNDAGLSGSIDFDDVIIHQSSMQPWDRQVRDVNELVAAGLDPDELVATVTLDVEVPTPDGEVAIYEVDCYAIGEEFDTNLAHGDLGDGETWYLVTPCDEPGCTENAYVSLLGTVSSDDAAPSSFDDAIAKAQDRSRRAFCPDHRYVHSKAAP